MSFGNFLKGLLPIGAGVAGTLIGGPALGAAVAGGVGGLLNKRGEAAAQEAAARQATQVSQQGVTDAAHTLGGATLNAQNAINGYTGQAGDVLSAYGGQVNDRLGTATGQVAGTMTGATDASGRTLGFATDQAGQTLAGGVNQAGQTLNASTAQAGNSAMGGFNWLAGSPVGTTYLQGGADAAAQQQALLGLGGDSDAAARAFAEFQGSTGFRNQLEQGGRAITGSAAARGLLGSGSTAKALQSYGQGLAQQSFNNYFNQLGGLSAQGLQAGGMVGNAASAAAAQRASIEAAAGQQAAGMQYGAAGQQAANQVAAASQLAGQQYGAGQTIAAQQAAAGQQAANIFGQYGSQQAGNVAGAGQQIGSQIYGAGQQVAAGQIGTGQQGAVITNQAGQSAASARAEGVDQLLGAAGTIIDAWGNRKKPVNALPMLANVA